MNTTTNTRGVSEAMVAELIAAGDFLAMNGTDGMVRRWEKAKAALSAPEPAAQGEEGFDVRKYVRHMADVLEAGGDLFKVDADLLRLAAAINKAANTAPPAQPAERVPSVCDGKEQDAFEAWASSGGYNMTLHPLHWLFLDKETYAARQGWKGALEYVASLAATPAAPAEEGDGKEGVR